EIHLLLVLRLARLPRGGRGADRRDDAGLRNSKLASAPDGSAHSRHRALLRLYPRLPAGVADMDLISHIMGGFAAVADPWVLMFVFAGAIIGLVFGAAPGLTATSAIVLFLPVTYAMVPVTSMALLLGIYCSGYFAGSIPAILLNTPGAPGSAATALDGYAMAQAGHGDRAIVTAICASFVGGLFSLTLLA